jgi:hypothetical protein
MIRERLLERGAACKIEWLSWKRDLTGSFCVGRQAGRQTASLADILLRERGPGRETKKPQGIRGRKKCVLRDAPWPVVCLCVRLSERQDIHATACTTLRLRGQDSSSSSFRDALCRARSGGSRTASEA